MKPTTALKTAIDILKNNWIRYGFETLVVINGILIAFALDNWNENRLENIKETQYLNRLVKDIQADTIYYNDRIASSENLIIYHSYFVRTMYQTQQNFEEVEDLYSRLTWNSQQLTTQNATYIELTSSGHLDILKNQELKDAVIKYYRKNEEAAKHVTEFNEFSVRLFANTLEGNRKQGQFYHFINDVYDGIDFIKNEDWAFMNDPTSEKFQALEHTLNVYRLKHQTFLDQYFKPLKNVATELIMNIQKELEARN